MELHQLEAFSAVMSVGSITGAGRLLNRSQPAVTRQVQELEADLGYVLFHRNGPRVTPTEQAFLLYEEVERSLVGMQAIEQRARAIGQGNKRPITVCATASLAASVIPHALAQARSEREAATRVHLRTQSAEHVAHSVLTDHADIGLVTLPIAHAGINVHWIASAPCVVGIPTQHPLAANDVIGLADLAGQCLATVANRHRLRHRIDAALEDAGIKTDFWLETNNSLNALMSARCGAALAIVDPASAIGQAGNGLTIKKLDVAIPFLFGLVTREGREQSAGVQTLLEAIRLSTLALLDDVVMHRSSEHDALLQPHIKPAGVGVSPRPASRKRKPSQ